MNAVREGWQVQPDIPAALAMPLQELMARLLGAARERSIRQLMLVGAASRVGTSTIAGHWSALLAAAFGNVLLIEVKAGAADGFSHAGPPAELVRQRAVTRITMPESVCLALMGTGQLPAEWLEAYGLVIWDVPPLAVSPAAMVLARHADATVLVTQAHRTRRQVARHSVLRLQESGGRLLGVVLNRTPSFIPDWLYRLL